MPAMFASDVLAVYPMMPKVRHMAGDPNHFIIAGPITRAVVIVGLITNLDGNASSHSDWSENARGNDGHEQ